MLATIGSMITRYLRLAYKKAYLAERAYTRLHHRWAVDNARAKPLV